MVAAYSPHGDVVLKRSKDVAAGTYMKAKPEAKKDKKDKKDADDAKAPSPAAAPLAEKVKNATAAAKDKVADAVDKAVDKVAAGRKLLSFADLNPSSGRRSLLQKNCGLCEYVDRSGACQTAPASLDCDGIVGMQGEWACGTCESESFSSLDFFLELFFSTTLCLDPSLKVVFPLFSQPRKKKKSNSVHVERLPWVLRVHPELLDAVSLCCLSSTQPKETKCQAKMRQNKNEEKCEEEVT